MQPCDVILGCCIPGYRKPVTGGYTSNGFLHQGLAGFVPKYCSKTSLSSLFSTIPLFDIIEGCFSYTDLASRTTWVVTGLHFRCFNKQIDQRTNVKPGSCFLRMRMRSEFWRICDVKIRIRIRKKYEPGFNGRTQLYENLTIVNGSKTLRCYFGFVTISSRRPVIRWLHTNHFLPEGRNSHFPSTTMCQTFLVTFKSSKRCRVFLTWFQTLHHHVGFKAGVQSVQGWPALSLWLSYTRLVFKTVYKLKGLQSWLCKPIKYWYFNWFNQPLSLSSICNTFYKHVLILNMPCFN